MDNYTVSHQLMQEDKKKVQQSGASNASGNAFSNVNAGGSMSSSATGIGMGAGTNQTMGNSMNNMANDPDVQEARQYIKSVKGNKQQ